MPDAGYAAMRRYVDTLDAHVVAFQEIESKAAAEREFDPARGRAVVEHCERDGRAGAARRRRRGVCAGAVDRRE